MNSITLSKRLFISVFLVLAFISFSSSAGSIELNAGSNDIQITQNTNEGFKVTFSFSEFNTMDVKTSEGIFSRILVPGYARHGEFGNPELPVKSEMIEIPVNADVKINVTGYEVKEYSLKDLGISYPVMPNQPPVPKSGDIPAFAYNKSAYKVNAFSKDPVASVEVLGVMRGVTIGRLDIMPVQYNPVTKMIRVYEKLEVEVDFENADQAATAINKETYYNHSFAPVFSSLLNFRQPTAAVRENMSKYPVKYVIVSDPMFEDQLQPFIEWKTKKGFTVTEAYTNDPNVGTTTGQIKAYLQGLYNAATPDDPAPTYVLFVGDIAQVPAFTGEAASHVTDLYYCEYTGDYFPEVFYGRFSATNTSQLQPQIDKTLMYEQYTMPQPSYLDSVVMIAGMDGSFGPTHGNGQINYGTENYFNAAHGLYSHTYLYPESGSNSAQIRQNISDGVTYANYTAHGSPDGWADPSFTVAHIAALQNEGQYGLLVGNCCSTSEYQVGECFGEAIVRAANKGAVGYIGASNSTYWDEDYYFGVGVGTIAGDPPSYEETSLGFYDRMFHDHGEPFLEWYTTAGQMIYAGNLAVTEGSAGMAEYYWEAYCLMGDPSLMVYFSEPPVMTVTFDPLLPLGSATFTINAAPYAYVGLSMNGTGLGAALADETGVAVVELTAVPEPGNADVVVTAQNFQPFMGTVLMANPAGPYVMLNEFVVDDSEGNNNGMAEFGETILLDVELKNWGNGDALNTLTDLSTDDAYVSILDNEQAYGTIISQDSVMQTSAFRFQVHDSIPDMHAVNFNLNIQGDARESWGSTFSVMLFAPVMHLGALSIVDTAGGNGNFRFDPGETVDIVIECHNTGHCDAHNIMATLQSSSPLISIENSSCTFETISWNGMHQAVFTAVLDEEIETGTLIDLGFNLSSDPYADNKMLNVSVGLVIEDFETGDFTSFGWIMSGNQPWQITNTDVFDGMYSARSGVISDSQTSVLSIDVNVATDDSISFYRKVSCEDDPYNDNYDWLAFYIDNIEMGRWDGNYGWGMVAYPVSAGQHTFKWVYNKDYSVAGGQDAAWIDNIVFPAIAPFVGVGEASSKELADFRIMPNPVTDKAELIINLASADKVSIAVYDLAGNRVSVPYQDYPMNKETEKLSFNTGSLASGMYFCILKTNSQSITKKLIISK